jgi:hypothetical protein
MYMTPVDACSSRVAAAIAAAPTYASTAANLQGKLCKLTVSSTLLTAVYTCMFACTHYTCLMGAAPDAAALSWALSAYSFDRYKAKVSQALITLHQQRTKLVLCQCTLLPVILLLTRSAVATQQVHCGCCCCCCCCSTRSVHLIGTT